MNQDPWAESWLECQRLISRILWRVRLFLLHWRLQKKERLLGELGWQQADFHPQDPAAKNLANLEVEQARLLFEIGELQEHILHAENAFADHKMVLNRKIEIADQVAVTAEKTAAELIEKLKIETALESPALLNNRLQSDLEIEETNLRSVRQTLQRLRAELLVSEQTFQREISELKTSLQPLEARQKKLIRLKSTHFYAIGQELADAQIAPLNQPEILTQILNLREKITDFRAQIKVSLSLSATLPWSIVLSAQVIFALMVFAAACLVFLAVAIPRSLRG